MSQGAEGGLHPPTSKKPSPYPSVSEEINSAGHVRELGHGPSLVKHHVRPQPCQHLDRSLAEVPFKGTSSGPDPPDPRDIINARFLSHSNRKIAQGIKSLPQLLLVHIQHYKNPS